MTPIKEELRNNNEANFLKGILDGIDDEDYFDDEKNKIFHNNEILTFEEEKKQRVNEMHAEMSVINN